MKKQHFAIGFLASLLGLAAVGCSDEAVTDVTPVSPDGGERITVTASAEMPQGDADTRVVFNESSNTLGITWRSLDDGGGAETFSVVSGTTAATPTTFTLTELDATDPHKGIFEGKITAGAGATYYAVYPKVSADLDPTAVVLDMTGQVGVTSADNLNEGKTVMYAASQYADGNLNFGFKHLTSVLKLTLNFPDSKGAEVPGMGDGGEIGGGSTRANTASTVSDITLTADGMPVQTTANITGADAVYATPKASGTLSLSGSFALSGTDKLAATVYLHVLPGTWQGLTVEAKIGERVYGATITTDDISIAAGKMYRATAEMKELKPVTYTVKTTVGSGNNYYVGRDLQIGTTSADGTPVVLGSAKVGADGAVTVSSIGLNKLAEGTEFWVCIPKVVKFFHTMTEAEATGKAVVLPDKEAGSTLKTSPVAGGKAYENDWIVALYMGVNKDGSTAADAVPLYWATGNLIATKTSAAGEATTTAFHIATAGETITEGKNDSPYNAPAGIAVSATDGYTACALGAQWNMFGWGDVNGLKTSQTDADYGPNETICGNPAYDIARAQLGGSWRLPTCGYDAKHEFAAFDDNNNSSLSPDGANWNGDGNAYLGRQYTYTEDGNGITNTLNLPAAGLRTGKNSYATSYGDFGYYRSGTNGSSTSPGQYFFLTFDEDGANRGNSQKTFGMSVRPVTE